MYEYKGDGYDYEKGAYTNIPFKWNQKSQTLTIGARTGTYANYLKSRTFNIVVVGDTNGGGIAEGTPAKKITYTGKPVSVKI